MNDDMMGASGSHWDTRAVMISTAAAAAPHDRTGGDDEEHRALCQWS